MLGKVFSERVISADARYCDLKPELRELCVSFCKLNPKFVGKFAVSYYATGVRCSLTIDHCEYITLWLNLTLYPPGNNLM